MPDAASQVTQKVLPGNSELEKMTLPRFHPSDSHGTAFCNHRRGAFTKTTPNTS